MQLMKNKIPIRHQVMFRNIVSYLEETVRKPVSCLLFPLAIAAICWLSLYPIQEIVGTSLLVFLCCVCFAATRAFPVSVKYVNLVVNNWLKRVLTLGLFVFFYANLFGVVFGVSDTNETTIMPRFAYYALAVIWLLPIFVHAIYILGKLLFTQASNTRSLSPKTQFIGFVILLTHYLLWLYAFNPCISSSDSAGLYNQAHLQGIPIRYLQDDTYSVFRE